jgi:transposase
MPAKPYTNAQWLRRKYSSEGLSAKEIADLCGVTEMTITRWLTTFNIIRAPRTWSNGRR